MGLYKGMSVAMIGIVPYVAANFYIYGTLREKYVVWRDPELKEPPQNNHHHHHHGNQHHDRYHQQHQTSLRDAEELEQERSGMSIGESKKGNWERDEKNRKGHFDGEGSVGKKKEQVCVVTREMVLPCIG